MDRYYIYKGHKWVEVDVIQGVLRGCPGEVGFVCSYQGYLRTLPAAEVCHELQEHALGRQSRVRFGPMLPSRRYKSKRYKHTKNITSHVDVTKPRHEGREVHRNTQITRAEKHVWHDKENQPAINNMDKLKDSNSRVDTIDRPNEDIKRLHEKENKIDHSKRYNGDKYRRDTYLSVGSVDLKKHKNLEKSKKLGLFHNNEDKINKLRKKIAKLKHRNKVSIQEKNKYKIYNNDDDEHSKNRAGDPNTRSLSVKFGDLEYIRRLLHSGALLPGTDVSRFVSNAEYRINVLYRLQPLVKLTPITEKSTKSGISQQDFAFALGLTDTRSLQHKRHSSRLKQQLDYPDQEKENQEQRKPVPRKLRGKIKAASKDNRLRISHDLNAREYSAAEEEVIVRWLREDPARQQAVSGNRVWQRLQDEYQGLTGRKRTWHSLRGRYLRFILPKLGPMSEPARRRNSIFSHDMVPVLSASARQPLSDRQQPASPKRSLLKPAQPKPSLLKPAQPKLSLLKPAQPKPSFNSTPVAPRYIYSSLKEPTVRRSPRILAEPPVAPPLSAPPLSRRRMLYNPRKAS